jgi:hypothetical protein
VDSKLKPKLVLRAPPDRSVVRWRREEAVRRAEVGFITDDRQRPLEFWWEQFGKGHLSLDTMRARAKAGKWVNKRRQYLERVQEAVLRDYMFRAIRTRSHDMRRLQELMEDCFTVITPRVVEGVITYPVKPNSLEGMIGAICKLDALVDAKREQIMGLIEPELAAREKGSDDERGLLLPVEDARATARFLLERRRKDQQQRLAAEEDDGDGDSDDDSTG